MVHVQIKSSSHWTDKLTRFDFSTTDTVSRYRFFQSTSETAMIYVRKYVLQNFPLYKNKNEIVWFHDNSIPELITYLRID